jgi:hypothetical protein
LPDQFDDQVFEGGLLSANRILPATLSPALGIVNLSASPATNDSCRMSIFCFVVNVCKYLAAVAGDIATTTPAAMLTTSQPIGIPVEFFLPNGMTDLTVNKSQHDTAA